MMNTETCNRCGGENVTWYVSSPLWNFVMRGNDINGEPRYRDLVCVGCFWVCAMEAGLKEGYEWTFTSEPVVWSDTLTRSKFTNLIHVLSISPEPPGLIYETPSGLIWDRDKMLWVEKPEGFPVELLPYINQRRD